MNEGGARVIADPATAEGQRRISKSERIDSGNTNVDGVSLHVLAVFRHSGGARTKEFIAPGSAVAANNIDFRVGMTDGSGQIGKNIEDVWIKVFDVARAVVAQKVIQLRFSVGKIAIAYSIDDINALASVGMIQAQMMLRWWGGFHGAAGTPPRSRAQKKQDERKGKSRRYLQENLQHIVYLKQEVRRNPKA
jgi:hypothetical protein